MSGYSSFPGALDNASGSAIVMETAKAFAQKRGLIFASGGVYSVRGRGAGNAGV